MTVTAAKPFDFEKCCVRLQSQLNQAGCRCSVCYERGEIVIDVPFEYFGQVQQVVKHHHISCVVRPF